MASYYYLISSLPMLRVDQAMPFGYDEFLTMCRGQVSSKKYKLLCELNVDSKEGPLVKEWAEFYGALSEELSYQRNMRLKKPCSAPAIRDDASVRAVTAALNAPNPLDAEFILLSLEFDKLDGLIGLHYFDDEALFGYALKLKLLQRQTIFDKEKGSNEFNRLLSDLQTQIHSI